MTAVISSWTAGFVYFIYDPVFDMTKIGTSLNPQARWRKFNGAMREHGLIYLGHIPGGMRLEKELHQQFADHRIGRSEWFDAAAVSDFIDANL